MMAARATPETIDAALLRAWPLPDHGDSRSKEDRGRALIVAGSQHVPGGALLAGEGALRAGAGKLQIATPATVALAMAIAVPEAKVLPLPMTRHGHVRGPTPALEADAERADALLVGAGMDDTPSLRRLVARLAARTRGVLVADAGAIGAFAEPPACAMPAVITPHAGEMASLLGLDIEEVHARPSELALRFAKRAQVVVVLKSPETWIATPDGRLLVHTGGCVGLGTSGSGDVLAGLITGLAARGATGEQAAAWGVYLHGRAGEELAAMRGRIGFLARELAGQVPRLMETC